MVYDAVLKGGLDVGSSVVCFGLETSQLLWVIFGSTIDADGLGFLTLFGRLRWKARRLASALSRVA